MQSRFEHVLGERNLEQVVWSNAAAYVQAATITEVRQEELVLLRRQAYLNAVRL